MSSVKLFSAQMSSRCDEVRPPSGDIIFVWGIHRWIPLTKASDAELWCFLWSAWVNGWVHNREADDLRHHCAHYDVTVMIFATDVIRIHQCRVECKQISSIELSIGICPDANVWRHVLVSTCSYVSSIQNDIDTSDKRKQPCSEPDRSLWDGGYSIANFFVRKILNLAKAHVRLFESHSYLTGVTTAELRWHLPNISMIFNI